MKEDQYNYIYGPVSSWRLGRSLGIDPLSCCYKICTFDCVYCQLGRTMFFQDGRREFVSADDVIREINRLPPLKLDYITFSGRGEPTLASNLGEMIRKTREAGDNKIAVITNSSLMARDSVLEDLCLSDYVEAKLDACSGDLFEKINRPMESIHFDSVLQALRSFRNNFKGKMALQIMFVKANRLFAEEIAAAAREIGPDEIHINTPLRRCGVEPLPEEDLNVIKAFFTGTKSVSVYEVERETVIPISTDQTLCRRGKV